MSDSANGIHRAALEACRYFKFERQVRRARGAAGDVLSDASGASVELKDFRAYVPGDDLRRVDWAAFARTGEPVLRLYRDEIAPQVDVVLDGSASMALDDGRKSALALEFAEFVRLSARLQGSRARAWLAGAQGMQAVDGFADQSPGRGSSILFDDPQRAAMPLKSAGIRVLISDFLAPDGLDRLLKAFAQGAAQLVVVMLLGPWESQPQIDADITLVDAESGQRLSVTEQREALQRYLRRLSLIQSGLREFSQRHQGAFVVLRADAGLVEVLQRDALNALAAQAIVSPA